MNSVHHLRSRGMIGYLRDASWAQRVLFVSIVALVALTVPNPFFRQSTFMQYAGVIQAIVLLTYVANIRRYKLDPQLSRKLFAGHAIAVFLFVAIPALVAYQNFNSPNSERKIEALEFAGSLAPKQDPKALTTLFFGSAGKANLSDFKAILESQKIPRAVFTLEKDWSTLMGFAKAAKTAEEIDFARTFFSGKEMTDTQIASLILEYARVRKESPWRRDYLSFIQYPISYESTKKFLASPKKDMNYFGLQLAEFTLDPRLGNEIRAEVAHFEPAHQRYALRVLSVLEGRPVGLLDWKPAVGPTIKLKVKGQMREIASTPPDPKDFRGTCDQYAFPEQKKELSRDQLNTLNTCIRYRARNADMDLKLAVDNFRWIDSALTDHELRTVKKILETTNVAAKN